MSVRPWLEGLRSRLKFRQLRRQSRSLQSAGHESRRTISRQTETLQDRTLLTAQVLLLGNELQILTDADEDVSVQEDPGNAGFASA